MSNTVTMIETDQSLKAKGNEISIQPYIDEKIENMGLQLYGLALFDGIMHEEPLACLENNGVKRYITGLNEYAPEVLGIEDKDAREAKIKEIRTTVAQLEKELATNNIKIDDENFWDKVKLLHPTNSAFWDKINIKCGNKPVYLDPRDPYDRIKIIAIQSGGFSIVAKSFEEAREMPTPPKFYLHKVTETASTKTEPKKIRNKALAMLQSLFDKAPKKLMYVAKVVDANSAQYRKSTPNDVIYDNMDNFINGRGVEPSFLKASQQFIEVGLLDVETIKLRAIIKDAAYYRMIGTKADGHIYHFRTNTMMGKNGSEVIEYLNNTLNEQLLKTIIAEVEANWN